jgi:hypothetical protein
MTTMPTTARPAIIGVLPTAKSAKPRLPLSVPIVWSVRPVLPVLVLSLIPAPLLPLAH